MYAVKSLKDWVQFRRLLKIEKLAENAENE